MLRTVFLGFVASFLPFLLAYLGIHVALHPPGDERTKKLRKLQFWGLSSFCAVVSVTQIVSNYYDQTHSQHLLDKSLNHVDKSLDHVDMKVGNLANSCVSAAQAQQWNQECINRIQSLASKWPQLMSKRSIDANIPTSPTHAGMEPVKDNNANIPTSPTLASTETAKNNSNVNPAMEALLHSLPNNVTVYVSDSPRCFDKYSMPAYEGCTSSSCEEPCITLSPNAKAVLNP